MENTWTQIHTNGADTTFARIYEYQRADLTKVWVFEKMNADQVNGSAEIFGEEVLDNRYEAERRLRIGCRRRGLGQPIRSREAAPLRSEQRSLAGEGGSLAALSLFFWVRLGGLGYALIVSAPALARPDLPDPILRIGSTTLTLPTGLLKCRYREQSRAARLSPIGSKG